MMQNGFRVAVADSDELLRAAYELRINVFQDEQGYERDIDSCVIQHERGRR